jgi:hypothetical protein
LIGSEAIRLNESAASRELSITYLQNGVKGKLPTAALQLWEVTDNQCFTGSTNITSELPVMLHWRSVPREVRCVKLDQSGDRMLVRRIAIPKREMSWDRENEPDG